MPEYIYWIIGVCLAILVMLLIIAINSKTSKKTVCECENKHEEAQNEQQNIENKEEKQEETKKQEEEEKEVAKTKEAEVEKEEKNSAKKTTSRTNKTEEKQPNKEEETVKTEEKEDSKKEKLNRYRVTFDKEQGNWVVKMDGGDRASRRCATKEEALKVAKELAEKKDASLSVHKKDGKFQKKANVK